MRFKLPKTLSTVVEDSKLLGYWCIAGRAAWWVKWSYDRVNIASKTSSRVQLYSQSFLIYLSKLNAYMHTVYLLLIWLRWFRIDELAVVDYCVT